MKLINSRPDLSVVRIYKQQYGVVGAGFVVSDEYILTCAHVVATALGIDSDTPQKPTQEVEIDFLNINLIKPLTASVEFWLPVNPGNPPEDIAVLKLNKSLPMQAQIAPINMTECGLYDHEFEACGFPERRSGGAWAEGVIKRYVDGNWIQLVDNQSTGYRLEEGFSGTPIWDKNLGAVVGIAVAADKLRPEVKAAFMIPIESIFQVWDRLLEVYSFDSRISSLISLLESCFIGDFKCQIETAYRKSLPQVSISHFPDTIAEIVRSLDTRKNDSENNYSCLEKFVGYLLLSLKKNTLKLKLCDSLRNWLEKYLKNYQDLLNSLQEKQEQELSKSQKPCLLIAVFDNNNNLAVDGWLIEDVNSYKPTEEVGCYSLISGDTKVKTDKKLSNLPELIKSFQKQSLIHSPCSIKQIHIFLPYSLIDKQTKSIDSLVIEDSNPYAPPIGAKYEVVVRFSERLKLSQNDQYSVIYKEKWKIVNNCLKESVNNILEVSEKTNASVIYKQLMPDEIVGMRLTVAIPQDKLEPIMKAFYFAGVPIALWLREEANNVDCCQELNNLCQECFLERLPTNIKGKRYQDWQGDINGIGNHLSLLWDDFDLVPKRSLIMS